MFREYLNNLNIKLIDIFDELESTLRQDNTNYVYVDGEEGDYGVITYYSKYDDLVATRTIHGGDSETVEFTPYGVRIIKRMIIDHLNNT